jgi:hypothetical protein
MFLSLLYTFLLLDDICLGDIAETLLHSHHCLFIFMVAFLVWPCIYLSYKVSSDFVFSGAVAAAEHHED